jgi:hypothetical protein
MRFALIFLVWLAVAVAAGASGLPARLRPPFPQVVLLALAALLVMAGVFWTAFRRWLLALPWSAIVAIHLTRFVGLYFIYLCKQGELSCAWAMPSGIGDIVVAVLAAVLLVTRAPEERAWTLLAWNVIGFADIAMVVVRAATTTMNDPASMTALLRLPLSLLVTFLVPIIVASHILLFARARR